MDTRESDGIRRAWDKVAPGYSELVTPCYFGLGARRSAVPASARACGFWMWRPAAVP
jgi:hypothetical protein